MTNTKADRQAPDSAKSVDVVATVVRVSDLDRPLKFNVWRWLCAILVRLRRQRFGQTFLQLTARSTLDPPFSDFAQGALTTLDVRFRQGGTTQFNPYVSLPFAYEALVKVVTGPAIKHQL